jgi:hypothetical protein
VVLLGIPGRFKPGFDGVGHAFGVKQTDLKTLQPVIDAMVSYDYITKGFPAADLIYRAGK